MRTFAIFLAACFAVLSCFPATAGAQTTQTVYGLGKQFGSVPKEINPNGVGAITTMVTTNSNIYVLNTLGQVWAAGSNTEGRSATATKRRPATPTSSKWSISRSRQRIPMTAS